MVSSTLALLSDLSSVAFCSKQGFGPNGGGSPVDDRGNLRVHTSLSYKIGLQWFRHPEGSVIPPGGLLKALSGALSGLYSSYADPGMLEAQSGLLYFSITLQACPGVLRLSWASCRRAWDSQRLVELPKGWLESWGS